MPFPPDRLGLLRVIHLLCGACLRSAARVEGLLPAGGCDRVPGRCHRPRAVPRGEKGARREWHAARARHPSCAGLLAGECGRPHVAALVPWVAVHCVLPTGTRATERALGAHPAGRSLARHSVWLAARVSGLSAARSCRCCSDLAWRAVGCTSTHCPPCRCCQAYRAFPWPAAAPTLTPHFVSSRSASRAQSLLSADDLGTVPFLVLGNKIDMGRAASEDELRSALGLHHLTTGKVRANRGSGNGRAIQLAVACSSCCAAGALTDTGRRGLLCGPRRVVILGLRTVRPALVCTDARGTAGLRAIPPHHASCARPLPRGRRARCRSRTFVRSSSSCAASSSAPATARVRARARARNPCECRAALACCACAHSWLLEEGCGDPRSRSAGPPSSLCPQASAG